MAVVFLNNLDLNGNQLLNARLQNLASDPGSADAGDIIYNTTSNVFKYYNGSAWVDPSTGSYTSWTLGSSGEDVEDGNTVVLAEDTTTPGVRSLTPTKSSTTITQNLGLWTKNMATPAAPSAFSTDVILWGTNTSATTWKVQQTHIDDIPVSAFGDATDTVDMGGNKILDVATPTLSTDAANKAYVDANAGTTYTIPTSVPAANVAAATLTGSDSSTDAVNFAGTTNQTKLNAAVQGTITIGLADNITTVGDITVGGGDITLSGTGRIQGIDTVTDATDAVNKTYVDNLVVGNLVFQGGYNASTNTPDLDSSPSSSIKKGWSYVVTVAGDFFTEKVEVGDFLIAQEDAPTTLAQWVTVQNNISLATVSTVGIGNVNIDGAGNKDGLALAYSSGTATVGLDINSLPGSDDVENLDPANVSFPVYDDDAGANQKITLAQIQQGISASAIGNLTAASTVVTHNLGTRDIIVQLYDSVTYDTVYADVSRTSTNTVTIAFASAPSNTIRYMIYSVEIQGI